MISRVQQICDSYESGFGHGMAGDGLDLAHTQHSDAEMGEAYQIGYEAGRESRVVFSPDWLPENARLETQLREPQEHWQNLAAELLVRLIGLTSRPDEQEWAKAASEAATLLNTKRAASAEVAPQPAPAARKGIAAGLFQTPPQPTTGGGPLPQSATDMPVGKYGIAAAVAQPKAKAATPFVAPTLTTREQPKTTSVLPQQAADMPVGKYGAATRRAEKPADAQKQQKPFVAPRFTAKDQPTTTSVLSQQATEMPVGRFGVAAQTANDAERYARIKSTPPNQRSDEDIAFANAYFNKQQEPKVKAAADAEAARLSAENDTYGFAESAAPNPAIRQRIRNALNRLVSANGEIISRKALVMRAVNSGATVGQREGQRAILYPRGAYNTERQISKTAMDFAEFLLAMRNARSDENPSTINAIGDVAETAFGDIQKKQQPEAKADEAASDTIQAPNGQPFKSQLAARRAASQRGVKDTHDVVPASEVSVLLKDGKTNGKQFL